jgi:hypothetical protein
MIFWKDFILDDKFGPLLLLAGEPGEGDVAAVMEDSGGRNIQETRQERQPARMVGSNLLESQRGPTRMEAGVASSSFLIASDNGGLA